MWGGNKT